MLFVAFIDAFSPSWNKCTLFARYRSTKFPICFGKKEFSPCLQSRPKIINFNGFLLAKVFVRSQPTAQKKMLANGYQKNDVKRKKNCDLTLWRVQQSPMMEYYNVYFSVWHFMHKSKSFRLHPLQQEQPYWLYASFDRVSQCCDRKYYVFDNLNSNKYGDDGKCESQTSATQSFFFFIASYVI